MSSGNCLPVECNYYDNFPEQKMGEIRAKVKLSMANYEAEGLSKSNISSKVYPNFCLQVQPVVVPCVANLSVYIVACNHV